MTNKNNGGPAFPKAGNEWDYESGGGWVPAPHQSGMTLRDYFAAKALMQTTVDHEPDSAARLAYDYADAMLKAREVKS